MADSEWKQQGLWAIDTANTIAWDVAREVVMTRSAADVLMLQELRRVFDDSSENHLIKSSRGVGWNLQASSAKAGTASLASGGVAAAAKRGTGIVAHRGIVRDGFGHRMHCSFVNAVLRGGIHCGSIHL